MQLLGLNYRGSSVHWHMGAPPKQRIEACRRAERLSLCFDCSNSRLFNSLRMNLRIKDSEEKSGLHTLNGRGRIAQLFAG